MPAEWDAHECTFMEWPVNEEIWQGNLPAAKIAYAKTANTITNFEPVIMIARPKQAQEARHLCGQAIPVIPMEHDDSWMRDNGPTFVIGSQVALAGINWQFNAWGQKTSHWQNDNRVASRLLKICNLPCFDAPMILEGGSIHVDGEGTLITTEECLLNPNRNPRLTRAEIEMFLKQFLGIQKIIWLKKGIFSDETDGHVDNVACFAMPGTVIIQSCNDPNDENYHRFQENIAILVKETDAKGRPLKIIQIPQPPATYYKNKRLPLSYINFYLVNGGLVFPIFGNSCTSTDIKVEQIFKRVFIGRKIVGIDGMTIIKGGGNIHCITQQMPPGQPAGSIWRDLYAQYGGSCSPITMQLESR